LFVVPATSLWVWLSRANSGRFVFPMMMAPALFNRATATASSRGMRFSNFFEPDVVRTIHGALPYDVVP
jgi:hypothetical protein